MKRRRQQAILDLVRRDSLGSQAAILTRLRKQGFQVTQPTVSRDLEELGLVRTRDEKGRLRYAPPAEAGNGHGPERLHRVLTEYVVGLEPSGNLVVVRTPPGSANTVAQVIDQVGLQDVIGTIAGDDTILLVAKEGVSGMTVLRLVQSLMEA
ncbi:MAG: arginine repressor, partial [Actinomycetota bacterium]